MANQAQARQLQSSSQAALLLQASQPQGRQGFQASAGQQQNGSGQRQALEEEVPRPRPSALPGESRQHQPAPATEAASAATAAATATATPISPATTAAASSAKAAAVASSSVAPAASSVPWTTAIAPSTATSPTPRPPPSRPTATATTRAAATATAADASYQSDSQPIDYSQGRTIPIPEDAPTKIFFFIEDLFFIAKIQETARKLGVKVAFIKNEKEAIAELVGGEEEDRPGLIVFDLNNANAKPLTLIPKLKTKLKRSTSIIGFLSHLQGDLKAKAVEAGCDTVMPRAAFSQNLPNLLRRYGMEEEEEPNFNQ